MKEDRSKRSKPRSGFRFVALFSPYGAREGLVVIICFVVWRCFWVEVSDSCILLLTTLTCFLLCQLKAARELRKERKKETEILYNFNFILGFNDYSQKKKVFLKPIEIAASSRQGVKIY